MFENILVAYGIHPGASIQPFGSGLINTTWQIRDHTQEYILQKVNHDVFRKPADIDENITTIAAYLNKHHPAYFFVSPLITKNGQSLVHVPDQGYFRLFPFVLNSATFNVTEKPEQAFEAARQFGLFTRSLSVFPVDQLKITLPDFHNLSARYEQFIHAVQHGNPTRIREAQKEISFLKSQDHIVSTYKKIISSDSFSLRVTHHDTKISNVLFNSAGKGICVIDLDTVMPGYYISDVGDMMRTYLSASSEEESDPSGIREEYFKAILQGYLQEMAGELSEAEVRHFVYSGIFLTYMQAIRFLTDHLNNDTYYGASYEGQNYIRAKNQISLLVSIFEKEKILNKMVDDAVKFDSKPIRS